MRGPEHAAKLVCHDWRMLPAVDESWDRIVAWLDRHAPPIAAAINPPVTEAALAQAEATLRRPLPADLVAW
jgi:cell wall assembly regulator SMI1